MSDLFAGIWSEWKQPTKDHVVDDVEMTEPVKFIEDVMRGVIVYVEVRAENDDRSHGIKTVIDGMGAKVNDRLNRYRS